MIIKLFGDLILSMCVVRVYVEFHIEFILGKLNYINNYNESQLKEVNLFFFFGGWGVKNRKLIKLHKYLGKRKRKKINGKNTKLVKVRKHEKKKKKKIS